MWGRLREIYTADETNSTEFIVFLRKLLKKFGKFVLFVDRASWHTSMEVKEFLAKQKGSIVLEYLPPYSPELNPIERLWRYVKANVLYVNFFGKIEDMVDKVVRFIDECEMDFNMSEYLG